MAYTRPSKFDQDPYVFVTAFGSVAAGTPLELGAVTIPVGVTELAIAWEGKGGAFLPNSVFPLDLQVPNDGELSDPALGDWIGGGGYRVPLDPNTGPGGGVVPTVFWASFLPGPGAVPQGDPPGRNIIQPYALEYPTPVTVRLLTGGFEGDEYVTGGELFYADPFLSPPGDPDPPDPCAAVPRVPYPYEAVPASIATAGRGTRPSRNRIVSRFGRIEAPIDVRTARRGPLDAD